VRREEILKEQYLKLSANDKKTFAKLVAEIKRKI
jgi:hypothetical protein